MLEGVRGKGGFGGGEGAAGYRPTTVCVSSPSPSVFLGKKREGGECGPECGCLGIFGPPSLRLHQFRHVHLRLAVDSVFFNHTNQIFCGVDAEPSLSGPPLGIERTAVVRLVLFCQAGSSPVTGAVIS